MIGVFSQWTRLGFWVGVSSAEKLFMHEKAKQHISKGEFSAGEEYIMRGGGL